MRLGGFGSIAAAAGTGAAIERGRTSRRARLLSSRHRAARRRLSPVARGAWRASGKRVGRGFSDGGRVHWPATLAAARHRSRGHLRSGRRPAGHRAAVHQGDRRGGGAVRQDLRLERQEPVHRAGRRGGGADHRRGAGLAAVAARAEA